MKRTFVRQISQILTIFEEWSIYYWGDNMSRNFGESKGIRTYLENRYGKIHNLTIDEEKELQKTIILDHEEDDLKRMFNKAEGAINISKDSQSLHVQPFSFFMVMITVLSSAAVGVFSSAMGLLNSIYGKYIDGKKLSKEQISGLLDSLDFTPIFRSVLWAVAIPFFIVLIAWFFFYRRETAKIDKRYIIYVLLKECIDNYDKIKGQVEPTEEN
ncbi:MULTISPECIES: hypothetical protein [Bacillus]|uniref:hypothetical protein n=2 Tax=Bacillus TaxID=1386 RepID=UPI0006A82C59|nr:MULTISPECIES: hypothetical protein [Bacillus]MCX2770929.1 hypothetical protein [Bacillus sp. H2FL2]AWQ14349.1 hypothetical protein C1N92_05325 [Bacillus velezensis]MBU0444104.1 hypothetical protein [Bacillus amyloliquefaciens]MDH3082249.1 hypothetical protein [Bacillus amyloliquefaciens]MDH3101999.1 hypothetical protein [Bacillus velezensis]